MLCIYTTGDTSSSSAQDATASANMGIIPLSSVPQIIEEAELYSEWDLFVTSVLSKYLEKQFVNQQLGTTSDE